MFYVNVTLWMFGLEKLPQENFLAYSTQFVFLTKILVPVNVVIVTNDIYKINPYDQEKDRWN